MKLASFEYFYQVSDTSPMTKNFLCDIHVLPCSGAEFKKKSPAADFLLQNEQE